jgi:hypothetical protein
VQEILYNRAFFDCFVQVILHNSNVLRERAFGGRAGRRAAAQRSGADAITDWQGACDDLSTSEACGRNCTDARTAVHSGRTGASIIP